MNQPLNIGHRGARKLAPENTLESFQKALDLKVDGVELDVHLTADGELVVFHDKKLKRMTDGKGKLCNHSLSDLKKLKIYKTYEIPTLREVLDLIDRRCLVNIELKGKNTAVATVKLIQEYIDAYKWEYDDFIVSSFDYQMLHDVVNLDSNIQIAVLTKNDIYFTIEVAKNLNAKYINAHWWRLNSGVLKHMQDLGFKVIAWTVNKPKYIKILKYLNIDGIITDFPDRI